MDNLETFAPVPLEVRAAGITVKVLPLRMEQLPAFARVCTPLAELLLARRYYEAATLHYPELRTGVSIGAGVEPAWLDTLFPHDFVRLAGAVTEVNMDFFNRHVLPEIERQAARLAEIIAPTPSPTGEPSSPGSSSADTDTPTS